MRTEETEAAHVQHYLTLAALAFPEVAFTFQKEGRLVWQLPAAKTGAAISSRMAALRERLRALLGDEKLLPVNFSAALDDALQTARGPIFLKPLRRKTARNGKSLRQSASGDSSARRASPARPARDQLIFVNRRPVENRGINYALIEGYHTTLMKGRYPVCCLFLEIDPAAVDVNIHPAKREVKFHRESEVRKLVAQAVREALLAFHGEGRKELGAGAPGRGDEQMEAIGHPLEIKPTPELSTPSLPEFPFPAKTREWPSPVSQPPLRMGFSKAIPAEPMPSTAVPHSVLPPAAAEPATGNRPAALVSATPLLNVPLRLVGVIGRLYVVLESDRGLVLLDQHAAHERILFEQMLNRLEQNEFAPTQKLLLPETIELSPRDANFLRAQLAALTRLGVGLNEFGERTFLLDALPPFVKAADARRFVLDLVDELKAAGREVNLARLGEHTVAKTVCRHAVKANDPLAGPELENLVADLRRCAMPYTCPHGRPTLIEMNYRELEKKFGRTQ